MCLILLALDQHPEFPLVLAANRDEFHARPTEPMHWWYDRRILAGRDLRSGGTWLAVRGDGSIALVTNYRSGIAEPAERSRGAIPLQLLDENVSRESMSRLHHQRRFYGGFNALASDGSRWFYSGSEDRIACRQLLRGHYGLSNHLLQSDWPKVKRGRDGVRRALFNTDAQALHESLISTLRDHTPATDNLLPDTGVGLELERTLSPLFIRGEAYGTRATTIVTAGRHGEIRVSEQQYGPNGIAGECHRFTWQATPSGPV